MRTIDEMKYESLWRLRFYRVRGTTERIEKGKRKRRVAEQDTHRGVSHT